MSKEKNKSDPEQTEEITYENREWIESLDYVFENQGPERVRELLRLLQTRAQERGADFPFSANTPYINTIPVERQPARRACLGDLQHRPEPRHHRRPFALETM